MTDARDDARSDLLTGIEAIAAHLSITRRRAYHLHETGELPTFKHGGKVCARRSTLAQHFAKQEAAARSNA
ncbi:hypothetical protein J2Y57_003581 [Sphingomonas sp. BE137]|nr:hypothetical protein [Sphingomonas sp. BE137]